MQKLRVVHFRSKNILQLFKDGYSFFIMFFLYILGMLAGVLLIRYYDKADLLVAKLFDISIGERDFFELFTSSFLRWLPFMLLIFIFGTCIVGVVLVPSIVFVKGMEYGFISGYIYSTYSFSGIVYNLILIIPATIVAAFGLFFTARNSFIFSLKLAKQVMPQPRSELLYPHLTVFCKRFLGLIFICILAALLEAALCVAFLDVIKLS